MDWRRSYLMRSRDGQPRVRVVPELRSRTHYFPLNLMHPPYPVPWKFQMIFLRNVLIYFSRANQQRVLQACCDCLASGGYLMVGHSETTHGMSLPVKSIAQSVYQRI
jgi:chemotaxis protein methyltransferase CheR